MTYRSPSGTLPLDLPETSSDLGKVPLRLIPDQEPDVTDHRKKPATDLHNSGRDSNRHGSRSVLWWVGIFISVLLAVGAYSKDSLFVRYLVPHITFSVVRTTAMGGTSNTGIFRAYLTKFGELLAPVQIMLYLNIRNNADEPQSIEGILLEFQASYGNWIPARLLSIGQGVYADFGGATQLKEAHLLDLRGIALDANLGSGLLAPHAVASGWLLLEFPAPFRDKNMLQAPLGITIFSGFGERETHMIPPVDLPPGAEQTRTAFLKPSGTKRDISNLPILSEEDLMKKFDEERSPHPTRRD